MKALTVEDLFDEVAQRLRADDVSVEQGRMMNAVGLKTRGKFFAMVVKGNLVVKLPRERVDDLVASRAGRRFDPGHGRVMKEWVSLRPRDEAECSEYVDEARRFVASQAKA